MKSPWEIRAQASGLEILIYDEIGESLFSEGVTARQLAAELEAAGNVRDILVRINSVGGSVWEGMAIFNALIGHGARIRTQIDGLAASIASVVAMAAAPGQIAMHENSLLMIHDPFVGVGGGGADKLRKLADTLDTVKASMVRAYRRHSRLDPGEISQMMAEETWLDPSAAIAKGFAHTVITSDDAVAARFDLSRFAHVPAAIMAKARLRPVPPVTTPAWDAEEERRRLELKLALLCSMPSI